MDSMDSIYFEKGHEDWEAAQACIPMTDINKKDTVIYFVRSDYGQWVPAEYLGFVATLDPVIAERRIKELQSLK